MRTIITGIVYIVYMLFFYINTIKYNRVKSRGNQEDVDQYMLNLAKRWAKTTMKITGTTLEVHGEENLTGGPCLFVSNHQSYMDIPVILSVADNHMGFIAKKELADVPILGVWIKRTRSIFLDRDNVREAVKSIGTGIKYLQEGHSLCIFPEGTRSRSSNVAEFKKGSLKLAFKSGVPIVPITIDGTYRILEEKNRIQKAHVVMTIGKPIYTDGISKEEQNDMASKIRNIIISNLKKE